MTSKAVQTRTIDLEEVVRKWAEMHYDEDASLMMKWHKKMKRIQVNFDWSRITFQNETNWEHLDVVPINDAAEQKGGSGDTNSNLAGATRVANQVQGGVGVEDVGSQTKTRVLFKTMFRNNSKSAQDYTMRTEKTTRSSCTTNMETSYTKGIDMCVTLKTPCEVFEGNAGFHSELTLTKAEGETIEEELTWGVESHIKVNAGELATASLVVEEIKYSGNFVIVSTIRGRVSVMFTNRKDNNSHVHSVSADIVDILQDYVEQQRPMKKFIDEIITIQDNAVLMQTKGKCDFRFGIQQHVLLDQRPINQN